MHYLGAQSAGCRCGGSTDLMMSAGRVPIANRGKSLIPKPASIAGLTLPCRNEGERPQLELAKALEIGRYVCPCPAVSSRLPVLDKGGVL
jgi:hypothetical protein